MSYREEAIERRRMLFEQRRDVRLENTVPIISEIRMPDPGLSRDEWMGSVIGRTGSVGGGGGDGDGDGDEDGGALPPTTEISDGLHYLRYNGTAVMWSHLLQAGGNFTIDGYGRVGDILLPTDAQGDEDTHAGDLYVSRGVRIGDSEFNPLAGGLATSGTADIDGSVHAGANLTAASDAMITGSTFVGGYAITGGTALVRGEDSVLTDGRAPSNGSLWAKNDLEVGIVTRGTDSFTVAGGDARINNSLTVGGGEMDAGRGNIRALFDIDAD